MKKIIYGIAFLLCSTALWAEDAIDAPSEDLPILADTEELQPKINPPDVKVDEYIKQDTLRDITTSNSAQFSFDSLDESPKLNAIEDPGALIDVYGSELEQTHR
ncbi:hypothetical protein KDK77_00125 [bacterium]|nr:hypothetical protein [bacterium]MCP5461591.1 hypothetical protein [bacterium]